MGALTEQEIFDCIADNAKLAAEHCDRLARDPAPRRGDTYHQLRTELKLIEGACRQASVWRQDTRWLPIGLMMEEAHKRAGDWLRGAKQDGVLIKLAERHHFQCFTKLAENLRGLAVQMEALRTRATGRSGMILPDMLPGPHRDTRPTGFRKTQGGILLPGTVSPAHPVLQ